MIYFSIVAHSCSQLSFDRRNSATVKNINTNYEEINQFDQIFATALSLSLSLRNCVSYSYRRITRLEGDGRAIQLVKLSSDLWGRSGVPLGMGVRRSHEPLRGPSIPSGGLLSFAYKPGSWLRHGHRHRGSLGSRVPNESSPCLSSSRVVRSRVDTSKFEL